MMYTRTKYLLFSLILKNQQYLDVYFTSEN